MGLFNKSQEIGRLVADRIMQPKFDPDHKQSDLDRKFESMASFSGEICEPLGRLLAGNLVWLKLDPDREALIITNKNRKDPVEIALPYERIISFTVENEVTLKKSGSGIGGAVAGGLLFGGAGAVVGGMSGKGRTNSTWYGTLTYKSKDGDQKQIVFKEFLANGKNMNPATENFIRRINNIIRRYAEEITEL